MGRTAYDAKVRRFAPASNFPTQLTLAIVQLRLADSESVRDVRFPEDAVGRLSTLVGLWEGRLPGRNL